MSEQSFTTPGIVDSDAAAEAARKAVEAFRQEPEQLLGLGSVTDEELVAYVGDPTRCHPFGNWYPGLSPEQMQLAQMAALRTLTTREQFIMAADGPDSGDFVMPDQTLALLRLRDADPTFTAQRQTSDGVSWLIVRPVDDGCFLRELTTPQGYRAYALTDGGKQARADFIRFMYVPDDARPADVDRAVGTAQLEAGEGVPFLEGCDAVTTVVRVGDEFTDGGDIRVVHLKDGEVFVGLPDGDTIRYTGASVDQLREIWDEWRTA